MGKKTRMKGNELNMVTNTTATIIESPLEQFTQYLDTLVLGELLGIRNYIKAEYERVRQVKDGIINNKELMGSDDEKVTTTLEGLYMILTILEERHKVVEAYVDSKAKPIKH